MKSYGVELLLGLLATISALNARLRRRFACTRRTLNAVGQIWRHCNFPSTSGKMIVRSLESFMDNESGDSRRMDLHRRIALVLRKEPGLVHDLAERLRIRMATARSAAAVNGLEREWYFILTLSSPLQVIRLLEDNSERAVRLRQNSPFVSLLSTPKHHGTVMDQ